MSTVACPYCYNKINQSRLAYQCLGRGVPGGTTRCSKSEDPVRLALTNVGSPAYPTFVVEPRGLLGTPREAPCPHCGGRSGVRACPECHTPLSSTFAESRSPLVGVVGGKGAGKTVYLSVLHHELRTSVRRTFGASIRPAGDQQGASGSSREWLAANEEALFTGRTLFESTGTAAGGRRAPVVLEWRQPRTRLGRSTIDTTVLSFYDAAGEDLTTQEQAHTQAYLGVADGLVLLLDPWQLPGVKDRIEVPADAVKDAEPPLDVLGRIGELLRVAHRVRASGKVKTPLAVVFAKIDAFFPLLGPNHPLLSRPAPRPGYDEVTGQETHEHVKALLHEFEAEDIDTYLGLNFARFRYFAVSALGAPPDYDTRTVDPGGVQPFRVEEPLLWLLNGFGAIDRSRG